MEKQSIFDNFINKKPVTILLVRGENPDGNSIYAYVAVRADKVEEFMAAQKSGTFYPEDYGVIIEAGEGEPSPDVRKKMEDEYGFNHMQMVDIPKANEILHEFTRFNEEARNTNRGLSLRRVTGIGSTMINPASEKNFVETLYETYVALVSGYTRLEQKYDQILATLVGAQLSAPASVPVFNEDVSSRSRDRAMEPEKPRLSLERVQPSAQGSMVVRVEVDEDPLTIDRMGVLFTTLTTLTTKYWLISQGHFADLIEFFKSHDERFVREAQTAITRISYNSPLNFDIKLGATDVAQGVVTTIDGIVQTGQRLIQIELVNKAKELELQQAEQRFAEEMQHTRQQEALEQEKGQLELERLRLEVEQQRLTLLKLRLDAQRKSMDHAFDIAHKVIGQLHPQADDTTKRMLVQTYVGDILQLSGISFKSVTVIGVNQVNTEDK